MASNGEERLRPQNVTRPTGLVFIFPPPANSFREREKHITTKATITYKSLTHLDKTDMLGYGHRTAVTTKNR